MKYLISLLVVFCSSSQAADHRLELQLGFPSLLALRVDRPVDRGWRLGATFGMLPTFLVTPFFHPSITQDISDEYNIVVDPSFAALSAGFYLEWQPAEARRFLRLEVLANILHASARSYIVSETTDRKAPYVDLSVTAALPRIVFSYGGRLMQKEGWQWEGGIGVTVLLTKQIFSQRTGAGAAYVDAVPTMRSSLNDGLDQAESEITSLVSSNFVGATVLPVAWVSAVW